MIRMKTKQAHRLLSTLLAIFVLAGSLASTGCGNKEQEAKAADGSKLPENMSRDERVNAIKSNPKYSDAEKEQAIKNVDAQARMSRGEGGTAAPPGYSP
jgi:hypothetical protein